MVSSLSVIGVLLVVLVGAIYLNWTAPYDQPIRAALGPSLPYFELLVALLGFAAALGGSYFDSFNV